jgi:cellulose synthase/poly-beta-1,6-N-acetylglucosamine synthase-like glycosyltransferase/lysophospholipase L1-like esterase
MFGLFVLLVGFVAVVYGGYPVAVFLMAARQRRRPSSRSVPDPTVALVVPAHDEEEVIAEKVRNFFALEYPPERLQLLVVSDGSTDQTCDRVREVLDAQPNDQQQRARLVDRGQRVGKSRALSEEVPKLDAEIVVLTDANALYRPDAIRALVAPFADPEVGLVCGRLRYIPEGASFMSDEELYWRYEDAVKRWEGASGRLLVGNGSIYAVRAELFEPIPGEVADDFVIPLMVAAKGRRLVYESEAVAEERIPAQGIENFRAKARIVTRGATALRLYWREVLRSGPLRVLQYLLHKVARWLMGVALAALFVVSALGATHPLLAAAFTAQIAFHLLGFAAYLLARRGPVPGLLRMPFYFLMVNVAALVGLWDFARGTRRVTWDKSATTRQARRVSIAPTPARHVPGRRFSWRSGLALAVLLLFAGAMGAETGVRLTYAVRDWLRSWRGELTPRSALSSYEMPDPEHPGGWLLSPGAKLMVGQLAEGREARGSMLIEPLEQRALSLGIGPDELAFQVNEHGYKGPALQPDRELPRILAVGDSCTFGTPLDQFSYPRSLERELARRGARAEVVNAGVRSYLSEHVLSRVEEYRALEPDLVLVCVGSDTIHSRKDKAYGLAGQIRLLRVARVLSNRFGTRRSLQSEGAAEMRLRAPRPDPGAPEIRGSLGHTPSFLPEVEELTRKMLAAGSRVVLLTVPSLFLLEDEPSPRALEIGRLPTFTENPYVMAALVAGYNQALRELAQREGAELIDVATWSRRALVPRASFFLNVGVLNERGQERMGVELARQLAPKLRGNLR